MTQRELATELKVTPRNVTTLIDALKAYRRQNLVATFEINGAFQPLGNCYRIV